MEPEKETVEETFARGTRVLEGLNGSVSANDLANPTQQAPVTEVPQPELPGDGKIKNVLGSIRSESENAARLAEEQAAFQSFADNSSGFDIQNEQLERFGVTPKRLQRLSDLELQLNDANVESAVTKSRIGAGNSVAQGNREITQEGRENAIRNSGLAAEAAILQGNIETGRALANDAVNIAMQDRTFKANAQLQAIEDLKDVVDEETRQMLVEEQRGYEQELESIQRVKDSVDIAISTGAGTAEQIQKITDPNLDDVAKLKVAQDIIASASVEDRNFSQLEKNLKLQQIRSSISSASLTQKKSRLALCQGGDASYCGEFNIDPTALTEEEIEQRVTNQSNSLILQDNMVRLQGVIDNDTGLQLSSGTVRSPLLSSLPTPDVTEGGIFNVLSYPAKREAKEQFLGDVQYLLNNRVFDKLTELKAQGATFGSLSEGELSTIASASSNLSSLGIKDEGGNLIGFRGGEENLRQELALYQDIMQRGMDDININALQTSTKSDILQAYDE